MLKSGSILCVFLSLVVACSDKTTTTMTVHSAVTDLPSIRFVEVAPGINLEVLEWSSEGPPVVLLAGATHSAHVYTDFAPHLTDEFRVIGITRRRIGRSSAPEEPFGITEMAHDLTIVLDTLLIESAIFIGHSFGGAELSYLIQHWPERVRKAVYLDGAWDFYDHYNAEGWFDEWPSVPLLETEKVSPHAVSAYFSRTEGFLFPLAEILSIHDFDENGHLVALNPNVGNMFQEMIKPTLKPIDFSRMNVPMLIVRSIPNDVDDLFRGYASYDLENQRIARNTFDKWIRVIVGGTDRFVAEVPHAKIIRLEGGSHEVPQIHSGDILAPVRGFLLD